MRCKNCGNEVSKENNFCTNCGSKIEKEKSVNKIILVSLILIFVVSIIFVVIKIINKGGIKTSNDWYEPNGNAGTIEIYSRKIEKDNYDDERLDIREFSQISNTNYDYELLSKYKCTNSDCSLKTQISKDFSTVLIKDGDYVVYNFKTNKVKKTNLSDYDIGYLDDATKTCDDEWLCIRSNVKNNRTYYEVVSIYPDSSFVNILIDPDLNVIFADSNSIYKNNNYEKETQYVTYLDNGNVVYLRNNMINTYDLKTKKISTSKEYKNALLIDHNYVAVVDDGYLKILDLNGNEKAVLTEITDDMYIHSLFSGWYSENKKEGIYIVVEDQNVTCKDLSEDKKEDIESGCNLESGQTSLGYEYYYIPETGETGKIATFIGGYAKPVLYLYPTSDNTNVSVSFLKPELLTTTYPKYKNNWNVVANKNGDLKDKNGKYYYGLYWEEKGSINVDFKEGFYVTKNNAIDFLEEKLSIIGLNDKERNEFIMYWLPILEKNEKSLVYFELTDSRQNYNRLIINPKPDSLLRVAIHVKKVNKKTNIKDEKLPKFERKGFAAVEWGGVIHK